ncbi:TIGR00159 family protein [candidate division BRC1 bacterium HGW-BRC1-1]|nr:MAG: TIGR00159 family protein [candidate division BRC1 bacterium HGW-BRC1-1]
MASTSASTRFNAVPFFTRSGLSRITRISSILSGPVTFCGARTPPHILNSDDSFRRTACQACPARGSFAHHPILPCIPTRLCPHYDSMFEIARFLRTINLTDVADITIVAMIVFALLMVLRETRSPAAMKGLVGLAVVGFLLYAVARTFNFLTTTLLLEQFWVVGVLVFLIVFQNELRKALTDFGQVRVFRRLFARGGEHIDEILKAVRVLSRQKTGAIICIEQRNPLKAIAETGTVLDCHISEELLRTIFITYSPLHDGAVVVRGDRLASAASILPLSEATNLPKELGTRHRAALGLSEISDAAVIVVSEETGIISLAVRGKLERQHTPETLREALLVLMDAKKRENEPDPTSEEV